MMKVSIISLLALTTLAACGVGDTAVLFDGMQYKGRLEVDKENRRNFVATVSPVSQGLEGAREAAHYEGTRYCVRNYGRSDIAWVLDPEAEATALNIAEDTLTVQGRCAE